MSSKENLNCVLNISGSTKYIQMPQSYKQINPIRYCVACRNVLHRYLERVSLLRLEYRQYAEYIYHEMVGIYQAWNEMFWND